MIPFTTIPLVSACFLVLVGLLIGYLIWYRYRDRHEQMTADLRRQISELRSSLKLQTNEFADAHGKLTVTAEQLEEEQGVVASLKSQLSHQEKLYQSTAGRLEALTKENQTLRDTIEQAHAEQRELHDQLTVAKDHAQSLRDEAVQLTSQIDEQSTQIQEQQRQLCEMEELRKERDRLINVCREAEEQSEFVREDAEQSIGSLERQLTIHLREIDDLRKDNSEHRQQLELQEKVNHDLSNRVEAVLSDLERFEHQSEELQTIKAERDRLTEQVDSRQSEVEQLKSDLLEHQNTTTAQLDDAVRRCSSLERALASTSEELAQLQLERERLEGVEDEVVALTNQVRDLGAQLKQAKREKDEALTSESSTREIVAELRGELNDRLEAIEAMEFERDTATTRLKELTAAHEQATQRLDESVDRLNTLQSEHDSLKESHQRQDDQLQVVHRERVTTLAQLDEVLAQNEKITQQLTTNVDELRNLRASHALLKRDYDARVEQAQHLQQERDKIQALYDQVAEQVTSYRRDSAQIGQATVESAKSDATAASKSGPSDLFRRIQRKERDLRAADKPQRSNRLGKVFSSAPLRRDDLTRIQGIDAVCQEKLNSLGVYTYWQIMEWDEKVAREFARRLATDRVLKDDWTSQARRLHHQSDRAAA